MADRVSVLVADDDKLMRDVIRDVLEREGYRVIVCANGHDALAALRRDRFDLVILDVVMPDVDGYAVCRSIRVSSQVPVVMLTSLGDTESVVRGLENGADDYVVKPFRPRELVARLTALQRRTGRGVAANLTRLQVGDLEIDRRRHRVAVRGTDVVLSPTEFDLLVCLANRPGEVFDRQELLNKVWGTEYVGDTKMVDVCVRRLRQKVELDPASPTYILTVRGVGYALFEGSGDATGIRNEL